MKFYTPATICRSKAYIGVKGGTEMDGPNRLEELVNTYETTLYRAALAILGDAHEAGGRGAGRLSALSGKGPGL